MGKPGIVTATSRSSLPLAADVVGSIVAVYKVEVVECTLFRGEENV